MSLCMDFFLTELNTSVRLCGCSGFGKGGITSIERGAWVLVTFTSFYFDEQTSMELAGWRFALSDNESVGSEMFSNEVIHIYFSRNYILF